MFSFECYDMLAMSSCYSAGSIRTQVQKYDNAVPQFHWFMYVMWTRGLYAILCIMETVIKAYFEAHISCGLMMQSLIEERNNALDVVECKITLLTVLENELIYTKSAYLFQALCWKRIFCHITYEVRSFIILFIFAIFDRCTIYVTKECRGVNKVKYMDVIKEVTSLPCKTQDFFDIAGL